MTNPAPLCAHCGVRLLEYRGSWFGPGDNVRCPDGETRHVPTTEPRTLTLAEVNAGADRAAERVAAWPEWKREIGIVRPTLPCARPVGPELAEVTARLEAGITEDNNRRESYICATKRCDKWRIWGGEVGGFPDFPGTDTELRALIIDTLKDRAARKQDEMTRASIAAFLDAEAQRFDDSADEFDNLDKADSADRCRTKAGHTRTIAAQIERGDDRLGDPR